MWCVLAAPLTSPLWTATIGRRGPAKTATPSRRTPGFVTDLSLSLSLSLSLISHLYIMNFSVSPSFFFLPLFSFPYTSPPLPPPSPHTALKRVVSPQSTRPLWPVSTLLSHITRDGNSYPTTTPTITISGEQNPLVLLSIEHKTRHYT